MREDIAFDSSGLTLRGWLYRPRAERRAPAIVMSHGFSAVKEQGLAAFAEHFRDAGFAVIVFDYRHLGASDGGERGRIIPQEQHDDLRAALGFASGLDCVDRDRIGLWGTSYAGGHAMFVGMLDPRVKAIVAQAPAVSVARSLMALAGPQGFGAYLDMLAQDHATRNAGGASAAIPVVAPAGEASVLSTPDAHAWFGATDAAKAGTWVNRTTLESVARMIEYLPASFVGVLPQKPLLLIAGRSDALIPIGQVRGVAEAAGADGRLIEHPCGHFDFYPGGSHHDEAKAAAAEWFVRHLGQAREA